MLLTFIVGLFLVTQSVAQAAINEQIPFYGTLKNTAGTSLDGDYDMVFRFYDALTGGALLDTSTHTAGNGNQVTVTEGEFFVLLGSGAGNALDGLDFDTADVYVGITIEGDSEMTPRERLGAAPYAFNSDTVDGYDANQLLRYNATGSMTANAADALLTLTQTGSGDIFNVFDGGAEVFTITDGGRVGISSSTPLEELSVTGDAYITGRLFDSTYNAGTNGMVLQTTGAGFAWVATSTLGLAGGGGGSLFTDAGALTYLTSVSDELAIGTTTLANAKITIQSEGVSDILNLFETGGSEVFTVLESGDVGIGTSTPDSILHLQDGATTKLTIDGGANTAEIQFNESGSARWRFGYDAVNNKAFWRDEVAGNTVFQFEDSAPNHSFYIDASGNIGFGEDEPGSRLSVVGNGSIGSGYSAIAAPADGFIVEGNVGIGSSTPTSKLVVDGDIDIDDPSSGLSLMGTRMFYASTTNDSIAIGEGAGAGFLNDGIRNIALGRNALAIATSSDDNLAIGDSAGLALTEGTENILIGRDAGRSITTGVENILIGYQSGYNTTGSDNTFIGALSGYNNTSGSNNSFFGRRAGLLNTTGTNNVAMGYHSLMYNATGVRNTALGHNAGRGSSTEANLNIGEGVYLGYFTGENLESNADGNILIGYETGSLLTTGANNILIGYDVELQDPTASQQLNIGNLLFGQNLNATGTDFSTGNIGIASSSPTHTLSVAGDVYITGALYDNAGFAGNNGYILQSDGNGFDWVATSSLGISGGGGSSPFTTSGDTNYLTDTTSNIVIGTSTVQSTSTGLYVQNKNIAIKQGDLTRVGLLSSLSGGSEYPEGIAISGDYAYGATNDNDFYVFDISDPTSPREVGLLATTSIDYPQHIEIAGDYAYLTDISLDALHVIDISNPSDPTLFGTVISDDSDGGDALLDSASDFVLYGSYALITSPAQGSITVVDISSTTDPFVAYQFADASLDGIAQLDLQGQYLYAQYDQDVTAGFDFGMVVLDVSDPLDISIVSTADPTGSISEITDIVVSGNALYARSFGGVHVFDVTDPTNLNEVAIITNSYLTRSGRMDVQDNYLAVTSDDVVSDMYLTLYDVSSSSNPMLVGISEPMSGLAQYDVKFSGSQLVLSMENSIRIYELPHISSPAARIASLKSGLIFSDDIQIEDFLTVDGSAVVGHNLLVGSGLTISGNGGLHLAQTVMATTSQRLYNISGNLYWDGAVIGGTTGLFTDEGASTYLTSLTDNLALGTSTADGRLTVEAAEDTALISLNDSTNDSQANIFSGTTSPESRITAGPGSLFVDTVDGVLYQKASGIGNIGWLQLGYASTSAAAATSTHGASIERTSNQSVNSSASTEIAFNATRFDNGSLVSLADNSITVKRAGMYTIASNIYVQTIGNGVVFEPILYVNGSPVRTSITRTGGSGNQSAEISEIIELSAGDEVTLNLFHVNGSAVNVGGGNPFEYSYLTVVEIPSTYGTGSTFFTENGSTIHAASSTANFAFGTTSSAYKTTVWGDLFVSTSTLPTLFVNTGVNQVMIGTTTPESGAMLSVDGTIHAENLSGGGTTLSTDANGNIIRTASDIQFKTNVATITDALSKVVDLRGVTYEWKDTLRFGSSTEVGFVAQEVDMVLPEVVRKGGSYWSLNTANIVALVVEAVKELRLIVFGNQQKIADLEARIEALEGGQPLKSSQDNDATGQQTSSQQPAPADNTDEEQATSTSSPATDIGTETGSSTEASKAPAQTDGVSTSTDSTLIVTAETLEESGTQSKEIVLTELEQETDTHEDQAETVSTDSDPLADQAIEETIIEPEQAAAGNTLPVTEETVDETL
ncbi:tail fiber domain-containing protein [Candidatus Pacebacteria bacterium]|nr:tail fiber domain-containing protein [Candidatus Paceibacterota bacterium]